MALPALSLPVVRRSNRKHVGMAVFKATSMYEQAKLIKKVFEEHGFDFTLTHYISMYDVIWKKYDVYMWFSVINPSWVVDWASIYIEAKNAAKGNAFFYATIEGIPYVHLAQWYSVKYVDFIANSYFTKDMLEKAGLRVVDVIHHAIDMGEVRLAKRLVQQLRRKLENDFPGKTIFCYVGRDDHRKQLDRLMKAIDILNEKAKDRFVLLMHVELRRPDLFKRPNVYITGEFGKLKHQQVLAFMGACDYLVFPSVCEGFGLPVLESMAMGTPVVHAWFPPLSEFSLKEYNVVFDYDDIEYWKTSAEQYFVMHMYDPKNLAEAMIRAMDIKEHYPSEYNDMRSKVAEHAKKWDYRNVYKKFVMKVK